MNVSSMPWKNLSLPAQLTRIRSMLSDEEKQYLMWLAAEKFEGWGAIVDLGPWLGSSSSAFAEGLKRRGKPNKIFSLDLFKWEPGYMQAIAHENLDEGDDFLPLFMREIGDYTAWVEPQKQDLSHYVWSSGPIEILFVDAAKTWELTNAIFRGFGAHLIPGRSRVVLQDFRHHTTHWLPLIFDSRPDLWKEIESVEDGWTVSFVPRKLLFGPAGIHTDYSEEAFPLEVAEHLLRGRMVHEAPSNRHLILRSLYNKCLCDGSPEDLQRLRNEFLAEGIGPDELDKMGNVESILVPRGWTAYNQHNFVTARMLAEKCLESKGDRPVYAVALLGMSLLRLGELQSARSCVEEVATRLPDFLPARLYRGELELAEGRYHEAAAHALYVLERCDGDEDLIEYSLTILEQAWDQKARIEEVANSLTELSSRLEKSPTFLAHLALEQFTRGRKDEGKQNLRLAIQLAPGHRLATKLQEEWNSIDDRGRNEN